MACVACSPHRMLFFPGNTKLVSTTFANTIIFCDTGRRQDMPLAFTTLKAGLGLGLLYGGLRLPCLGLLCLLLCRYAVVKRHL